MAENRWFKIWSLPDGHWLNEDLRYIGAWFDLIGMAEWRDRKIIRNGIMIEARRGNIYTAISTLADRWHVSRKWVRHFIEMLTADGMVEVQQRDNRGYTIKVNNYAKYQDSRDNRGTTEEQPRNNRGTTEGTTEGTTGATSFLISEELKEHKEVREAKRFTPPTINEIRAYIFQKDLKIDAERFFDYYEANGWKVGKNAMRDWKAACRSWASRDKAESSRKTDPNPKRFDNFKQRDADKYEDLVRKIEEERYGA